ncbi:MAG: glycogen-binding domain-containing protein [Desulfobacterales bacterium]|jgi:hypothetical protein
MTEELISMYIDDALDLDGKIVFVETVHANRRFKDDAVSLLQQEKQLRVPAWDLVPEVALPLKPPTTRSRRRPWAYVASALAAAALVLFFMRTPAPLPPIDRNVAHRFVVYQPHAETVAITGSFNDWQTLPMEKTGPEGYWEISLELRPGEHRYSFLLDDKRRVADPTVMVREMDDFGSQNSVLNVRTWS